MAFGIGLRIAAFGIFVLTLFTKPFLSQALDEKDDIMKEINILKGLIRDLTLRVETLEKSNRFDGTEPEPTAKTSPKTTPKPITTTMYEDNVCGSLLHYLEPVSAGAASRGFDVMCYLSTEGEDTNLVDTDCRNLLVELKTGIRDSSALLAAGGNFGCWRSDMSLDDGGREASCKPDYQHYGRLSDCAHCTYYFVCIDYPGDLSLSTLSETVISKSTTITSTNSITPTPSLPVYTVCGSLLHYLEPVSIGAVSRGFDVMCYLSTEGEDTALVDTVCEDLLVELSTGISDSAALLEAGGNFGCWRGDVNLADGGREGSCQPDYQHLGRLSDCGHCTYFFVCIDYPGDFSLSTSSEKASSFSTTMPSTASITPTPSVPSNNVCGSALHYLEPVSANAASKGFDVLCYLSTGREDRFLIDTACEDLLVGLSMGINDSSALLAAGGNFGCWISTSSGLNSGGREGSCRPDYQHSRRLSDCSYCLYFFVCIDYPEDFSLSTSSETVSSNSTSMQSKGSITLTPSVPASSVCGSSLHYLELVSSGAGSRGFDVMCYLSSEGEDTAFIDTVCEDLLVELATGISDASALLEVGGNFGCWRSDLTLDDEGREGSCRPDYQHSGRLSDCGHCTYFFVCIDYPGDFSLSTASSNSMDIASTTSITLTPSLPPSNICGSILHYLEAGSADAASRGFDVMCYLSTEGEDTAFVDTDCEDLLADLTMGFSDSSGLLAAGGNFGCWRSSRTLDDVGREGSCRPDYQHSGRLSDCGHCTYFFVCIDYPGDFSLSTFSSNSTAIPFTTSVTPTSSVPSNNVCGSALHYLEPVSADAASRGFDVLCYLSTHRRDSSFIDTTCEDLLIGLSMGINDSSALLAAGGNFGCWKSSQGLNSRGREGSCQPNYQHSGRLSDCSYCPYFFVCIDYPEDYSLSTSKETVFSNSTTMESTAYTPPTPSVSVNNVCGSLLHYLESVSAGSTSRGFDVMCYLSSEGEDTAFIDTVCEDLLVDLAMGISDSSALLEDGGNFGCWRSSRTLEDVGREGACRPVYQHSGRLSDCPHCTYFFVCIDYPGDLSLSTSSEIVSLNSTTLPSSASITPTPRSTVDNVCGSSLHYLDSVSAASASRGFDVMCYLSSEGEDTDSINTVCEDLLVDLATGISDSSALLEAGGNFGCWKSRRTLEDVGREGSCLPNHQHSGRLSDCPDCTYFFVCIDYPGVLSLSTSSEIISSNATTMPSTASIATTTSASVNNVCGSSLHYLESVSAGSASRGFDVMCYLSSEGEDTAFIDTVCEDLLVDLAMGISDSSALLAAGGNFGCRRSSRTLDDVGREGACRSVYQHSGRLSDCPHCTYFFVCIDYPVDLSLSTSSGSVSSNSATLPSKVSITPTPSVSLNNVCGSLLHYLESVSAGSASRGFDVMCYLSSEGEDTAFIDTVCEDLLVDLAMGISDSSALLEAGGHFGCWRSSRTLDDEGREGSCRSVYQHSGRLSDCPHCTYFFVCIDYPGDFSLSTSSEIVSLNSTTMPSSTSITPTPRSTVDNVCGSSLHYLDSVSAGSASRGFDVMCYLSSEGEDTDSINTVCEDLLVDLATGISDSSALLEAGGNFGCWKSRRTLEDVGREGSCLPNHQHSGRLSDCPDCTYFFVCIDYPGVLSLSTSSEIISSNATTMPSTASIATTTSVSVNNVCGSSLHYLESVSAGSASRGFDVMCYLSSEGEDTAFIDTVCEDLLVDLAMGISDSSALLSAGGNFGCWRSSRTLDDVGREGSCRSVYQHSGRLSDCPHCTYFFVCIDYPVDLSLSTSSGSVSSNSATLPSKVSITPTPSVSVNNVCGSSLHYLESVSAGSASRGFDVMCYLSSEGEDTIFIDTVCEDLLVDLALGISDSSALLAAGGHFGCWRSSRTLDDEGREGSCRSVYQHSGRLSDCPHCTYFFVCIDYPGDFSLSTSSETPSSNSTTMPSSASITPTPS